MTLSIFIGEELKFISLYIIKQKGLADMLCCTTRTGMNDPALWSCSIIQGSRHIIPSSYLRGLK